MRKFTAALASLVVLVSLPTLAAGEDEAGKPTTTTKTTAVQPNPSSKPNPCPKTFDRHEYRKKAKWVYTRRHVKPKHLYRLGHMRKCARSSDARQMMRKISRNHSKWRAMRKARAARECGTPSCNRLLGQHMAARMYGWVGEQFNCLDGLWGERESGWDQYAHNPSSGAHGIPQALPGSKMASAGPDWWSNVKTQIRWGLRYIMGRFGTPCSALSHSYAHGWY